MSKYSEAYKQQTLPPRTSRKKIEKYEPKEIPFDPNTYKKVGIFTPTNTNVGFYRSWGDIVGINQDQGSNQGESGNQGNLDKQGGNQGEQKNKIVSLPIENGSQSYEKIYTTINNSIDSNICPMKFSKKIKPGNFLYNQSK